METIGDYNTANFFKTPKKDSFLNQSQMELGSNINQINATNNKNNYIADWQVEYPENQPDSFMPVHNAGLNSHR